MKAINPLFLVMSMIATSLVYGATYTVPVPDELKSQATWGGIVAEAHLVGNQLTISYKLPEDLVGANSPGFVATGTGTGSFISVKGEDVVGYCMRSQNKPLECMVKYPRSIVDTATRDIALAEHFTGTQFEQRSMIARLFAADPAGLLSVELK